MLGTIYVKNTASRKELIVKIVSPFIFLALRKLTMQGILSEACTQYYFIFIYNPQHSCEVMNEGMCGCNKKSLAYVSCLND